MARTLLLTGYKNGLG